MIHEEYEKSKINFHLRGATSVVPWSHPDKLLDFTAPEKLEHFLYRGKDKSRSISGLHAYETFIGQSRKVFLRYLKPQS